MTSNFQQHQPYAPRMYFLIKCLVNRHSGRWQAFQFLNNLKPFRLSTLSPTIDLSFQRNCFASIATWQWKASHTKNITKKYNTHGKSTTEIGMIRISNILFIGHHCDVIHYHLYSIFLKANFLKNIHFQGKIWTIERFNFLGVVNWRKSYLEVNTASRTTLIFVA